MGMMVVMMMMIVIMMVMTAATMMIGTREARRHLFQLAPKPLWRCAAASWCIAVEDSAGFWEGGANQGSAIAPSSQACTVRWRGYCQPVAQWPLTCPVVQEAKLRVPPAQQERLSPVLRFGVLVAGAINPSDVYKARHALLFSIHTPGKARQSLV